ncbi:ankyrin repeat domain-containing protein [Spirillospora sp. NPDC047279]|uniref:ankyrin repeat domain-containing protein n=1 Tax=Spirillospora sp. NPDC047279 TaxID=3155478 RepID=UPI0033F5A13E
MTWPAGWENEGYAPVGPRSHLDRLLDEYGLTEADVRDRILVRENGEHLIDETLLRPRGAFACAGDQEALTFCQEIAAAMVAAHGIDLAEAVGRINRHWSGTWIVGLDIAYHELPEYWADRIYRPVPPLLIEAVERGDHDLARRLLDEGADPDAPDPRWPPPFAWIPLTTAAARGDAGLVRLLLAHGADVNVRDGGGGTALIWACNGGHLECARLLLEAGADVGLRNNDGYTAYGRAPLVNEELLALLRHHGAS